MFVIAKRLDAKLDAVLEGQKEIKALLEELRDHPAQDTIQEGVNAILGFQPQVGGEDK